MDMIAVGDSGVVDGRRREGLKVHGLRGPQGFQHGIEPLPRPLQQAAEARDGDPLRGRPLAVVGSPELLPEALRVQEPSQLLVLVEPITSGLAQGCVACGGTAAMGRVPIS
jgi:hypothetical protein